MAEQFYTAYFHSCKERKEHENKMLEKKNNGFRRQLASGAFFAVLALAASTVFLKIFSPVPYVKPEPPNRLYDRMAMMQAMAPNAVLEELERIEAMGSRSPGQAGHAACADYIESVFAEAGLPVYKQEVDTVHPLADHVSLTVDGQTKDVDIYPAVPNHVQPMVSPSGGISGRLTLVDESFLRSSRSFSGKIALLDLSRPLPKGIGMEPGQYADLGFEALIVAHPGGLTKVDSGMLLNLRMMIPFNYVRLVADERIFDLDGELINLDVRTSFHGLSTRNLIGLLKAGKDTRRAVVLTVQYDGFTALPDLNHSSIQALGLATQLQLLKGILPYRQDLSRDIIFVFTSGDYMAMNSTSELLSAIGREGDGSARKQEFKGALDKNEDVLAHLSAITRLFEDEAFSLDPGITTDALRSLTPQAAEFFEQQFHFILKQKVFEESEKLLSARIEFERNPDDLDSEAYRNFRRVKTTYDRMNSASSFPIGKFLSTQSGATDIRSDLQQRFAVLVDYHRKVARQLEQKLALNTLFAQYDEVLTISPALKPGKEDAAIETLTFTGGDVVHAQTAVSFKRILEEAVQSLNLDDEVKVTYNTRNQGGAVQHSLGGMPIQAGAWSKLSYPAFTVVNPKSDYPEFAQPLPLPDIHRLNRIQHSLKILGETLLATGFGNGRFEPLTRTPVTRILGTVYASGVGSSIVPNFPLAGALMCGKDLDGQAGKGHYQHPLFFTDPYGRYFKDPILVPFAGGEWVYSPEAAFFNAEGLITHYKDCGASAQNIYRSMQLIAGGEPVNLVLYRGAPVAILNRINPQTMKEFIGVSFLRVSGLVDFPSTSPFLTTDGILDFINPAERFYVALKSGSPENELVAAVRAFCLGVAGLDYTPDPEREIDGPGYLACDTPLLRSIAREAAASMEILNGKRIELQEPFGMVDEMTAAFHKKSRDFLESSREADKPVLERRRDANEALTYSILNHPVIRGSISEAIWGILWYMGLLVPFVFFFEKLVFGFSDIRKQLIAQGVIFLIVFMLLRFLHPAFEMIRSSIMILLGFVIILISGGITVLLSSKFRENLEALQRMQGHVKGAHVNKMGIMITAFMLGLNNMHKRKVRTGLTCATLVLMTFVMICFTSVQDNVVDQTKALGRAAYQGMLIKSEESGPIAGGELVALNRRYGEQFVINQRVALVGLKNEWAGLLVPPSLEMIHGEGNDATAVDLKSVLELSANEPLAGKLRLIAGGWFTPEQEKLSERPYPIILSDAVAETLRVNPAEVADGRATVVLNNISFVVQAIFDSQSLEQLVDLDSDTLLPFNVEAMVNPKCLGGMVFASPDDPRVPAAEVAIALTGKNPAITGERRVLSVAVDMGEASFKTVRREIETYLEQTGRATYYGLDGMTYFGKRARETSMAGMADMLIPLVIAALTVLNTMKGSVYERRDEIYVYNAVGIAPKYVFFMFIAEAMVYAVVGALLGYIMSQGIGRILTTLGWTGGLNMNFTSLSTVYASLTIGAAALLSTYFPAKSAMDIAKPTEDAGWSLPNTEEDTLSFDLPFTFSHYDRIAILGFFYRYFENHGEGSAGPFFAGEPQLTVADRLDELANNSYIPMIRVPVWLKPFDLGVSQQLEIDLATDSETGEYISRITLTRLTGTKESWSRLNPAFVAEIRRHFLHWRAVSDDMKVELYDVAKALLEKI